VEEVKSEKIFIISIDDDVDFNLLLSNRLKNHGIKIITTSTAIEFADTLKSNPTPDLCIVDLNLTERPGAGLTLIEAMTIKYPQLPIFVMSRRRDGADIIAALEAGALDYLSKPLDVDLLLSKIEHNLKTKVENFVQLPLLKIANFASNCTLFANFKIREINEFGIILDCVNFMAKGAMVKLFGEIISEIFQEESVLLRVHDVTLQRETGRFYSFLEFASEDQRLNQSVRNWLDDQLGSGILQKS